MGNKDFQPKAGNSAMTIGQYDGNPDSGPESDEEEQCPLENVQASKCGWYRTKTEEHPKGISFWSDPDRPPEEIIALKGAPPPPPPDRGTTQRHEK